MYTFSSIHCLCIAGTHIAAVGDSKKCRFFGFGVCVCEFVHLIYVPRYQMISSIYKHCY